MVLSFLTIGATFLWTQSSLFSLSQRTHQIYVTCCGLASTSHREPSPCFLRLLLFIVQWLSHVWLSATPRTAARQASPALHCLSEFAQTHVHWVGDTIQPSHPLSPPSLSALNLSQNWGLFQRVGSLHLVAKVSKYFGITTWFDQAAAGRKEYWSHVLSEHLMGWAQEHFTYIELRSEN